MSLPRPPHCSFTIPSIHDDVELDCRIYYPRRPERSSGSRVFGRGFAVFAHPYAPLGGCYDDPVVALAGGVLLQGGYFLTTFNFRGASGSAGRTSWTGKPELADYVSVYGFMVCYIDAIFRRLPGENDAPPANKPPVLILGGYSYGAMIASHLPAVDLVIDLFRSPAPGSAESEIRRRATDLAQYARAYLDMHSGSPTLTTPRVRGSSAAVGEPGKKHSPGVIMGGYESDAASRRRVSRENSGRSVDGERIRQSLDRIRRKIISQPSSPSAQATKDAAVESALVQPEVAYVIVSPILSMAAGFTTMFSKLRFTRKDREIPSSSPKREFHELMVRPCCCCYGTRDGFTSAAKLERWAQDLQSQPGSRLVTVSADTGHFWHEAEGIVRLRQGLAEFLEIVAQLGLPSDQVGSGETVETPTSTPRPRPRAPEVTAADLAAG
ncbi:hypothetical protein AYL99_10816 [Fonsecaea erecta]|uniref:AB hydrolase-1 domain-containing protein n=1 Tax=Fonsecaea erecta TaxID=1367422 RepID=A0A178Z6M4_9EURO|nr:hypothetical protein AYL99_10816 [Fonsecaea erecta]OAP55116.1 hypothetical protein AYL99_10816 [Fonsecaea erecta]